MATLTPSGLVYPPIRDAALQRFGGKGVRCPFLVPAVSTYSPAVFRDYPVDRVRATQAERRYVTMFVSAHALGLLVSPRVVWRSVSLDLLLARELWFFWYLCVPVFVRSVLG